jgi:uncharacterized protein YkwD
MTQDQRPETKPAPPRRTLRIGLVAAAAALALLAAASAFMVGGEWDGRPAARAAALQPAPTWPSLEPVVDVTPTPTPDAQAHADALARLAAAWPTTTPSPTPTPAPTEHSFASAQPTPPPAPPPASEPAAVAEVRLACPTASMAGFGLDLFHAINAQRAGAGLAALQPNGCATYVAQIRSNDMAGRRYFSHTSPDGSSAFSLLDAYAVPHGWAGENLARNNYPDAETVAVAIRDLMASASHAEIILSPNFTDLGVAVAYDGEGMYYYTMVFLGPP